MTMNDFDSFVFGNLGDIQYALMQPPHSSSREHTGRARSSGSLDRAGRSPSASKSQQRASSLQSHRRQLSAGSHSQLAGNDLYNEINMTDFWSDANGSPGGSPGPADIPMQSDQLLSFRLQHSSKVLILDQFQRPVGIDVGAQLHGMFFLAESPWEAPGPSPSAPKELTCYRRNLFQVSGNIRLPVLTSVVVSEDGGDVTSEHITNGKRLAIQYLEATISGIENVERSPVKIITVPWKNAASQPGGQQGAQQQQGEEFPQTLNARALEKEPPSQFFSHPLAVEPNQAGIAAEDEGDHYRWQLNWKRLQFRSATANNGRRKDLQQHFIVRLGIYATAHPVNFEGIVDTSKTEKILLCEAFSNAIIVRGRSPRNFSSRNDIPLTGSAIVSSRHTHAATQAQASSAAKKARHMSSGSFEEERAESLYPPDRAFSTPNLTDYGLGPNSLSQDMPVNFNFSPSSQIFTSQAAWLDPTMASVSLQNLPLQYGFDSAFPDFNDPNSRLSLSGMVYGDEFATTPQHLYNQLAVTTQDITMPPPHVTHRPTASRVTGAQSPHHDLLYEYFPIGIDDFMPPVEVVYRPHQAHHQAQTAGKGAGPNKRLFSERPFD